MLLKPLRLVDLLTETNVSTFAGGLRIIPDQGWVVEGENRLSYTTLTRLIECCREYHWREDIQKLSSETDLDSITKSISASFFHPVLVGNTILIFYEVKEVRRKGYLVKFFITNDEKSIVYAEYSLVFVFYSTLLSIVIEPPREVFEKLNLLLSYSK